jgi:hypothetical protein
MRSNNTDNDGAKSDFSCEENVFKESNGLDEMLSMLLVTLVNTKKIMGKRITWEREKIP